MTPPRAVRSTRTATQSRRAGTATPSCPSSTAKQSVERPEDDSTPTPRAPCRRRSSEPPPLPPNATVHGNARRGVHTDGRASAFRIGRVPVDVERVSDTEVLGPCRSQARRVEVELVDDAAGHPKCAEIGWISAACGAAPRRRSRSKNDSPQPFRPSAASGGRSMASSRRLLGHGCCTSVGTHFLVA